MKPAIFIIFSVFTLSKSFTISERFAKQVLNRVRRANAGEETFRRSDLDRECVDEQCSAEEYLEYAENIDKKVRDKFNAYLFEVNYVECSVALSESPILTNQTVINALKYALGFHVRGACLHNFELESMDTDDQNDVVKGDDDYDVNDDDYGGDDGDEFY